MSIAVGLDVRGIFMSTFVKRYVSKVQDVGVYQLPHLLGVA